jgi:hypothetical protein
MRVWPLLCFLALACLNSGCSWAYYSAQNLIETPLRVVNHCNELHHFHQIACAAWKHVQEADPQLKYSADYAAGFIDGYVDFLDAGGLGNPPAAPPERYLFEHYHQSPEGVQAIEDWFAGFRHGAAMARESGLRQLVVVPIALPPRKSDGEYTPLAVPPGQQAAPASQESLPTPRPLPPEPAAPVPPPQADLSFAEDDR